MLNKKDALNISLLLAITLIFFWQMTLEPTNLFTSGDLLSDSVFSSSFMHETYQKYGERALWNPYIFTGKPHVPHIEYGQYYFTSLLFLFSYKDYYLNFILIGHMFLAGLFMYLFLRNINLTRTSSTIGAITFMLGRNFLDLFAGDVLPVVAFSYVPLVFLGLEKLIEKRDFKWSIFFAAFVSIQFFAGRVQYFYYTSLALIIYTAMRLYTIRKDNPKAAWTALGHIAISAAIFLGIVSIQLLPMIEIAPNTIQNSDDQAATYKFSAQESVPPKHFITLTIPNFFGKRSDNSYWGAPSWMIDMYLGIIPLILAIAAIFLARNKYKWPLISLAAFSVAFALGEYAPFYRVFYEIPGVSMFKVPGRMLMVFTFSMAALSAIGANYILTNRINKYFSKILLFTGITGMVATAGLFAFKTKIIAYGNSLFNHYYYSKYAGTELVKRYSFEYFSEKIPVAFNNILFGMLILTTLVLLSYFIIWTLTKKSTASTMLIAVIILDLLFLTNTYDWDNVREKSYPSLESSDQYFEQWKPITELVHKDTAYLRILGVPQAVLVQSNFYTSAGSDSMPLYYSNKYSEEANKLKENAPFMLGLANVKYVLTQSELPSDYKLVEKGLVYSDCRFGANKSFNLYENKRWMPRAFVVPKARTEELEKQFDTIKNIELNPKNEVLIEETIDKEGGQEYKEANIDYYSPNKIKLSVSTEKPGFLVISETYYPGWKAYDNGAETKIYQANYIMRALYLPAGDHNIEFIYDPISYKVGKWITLTTLLILLITILLLAIYRNK